MLPVEHLLSSLLCEACNLAGFPSTVNTLIRDQPSLALAVADALTETA